MLDFFFEFLRIFLNHPNSDGKRILWYCLAWYVRFFSFRKLIFSSDRSSLRRVSIYPAGTQFFRFLLRPLIRSMIISMASWGHLGDFFFHFFHFYHFNSLFLQYVLFLLFLQCLQFLLFLFLLLCSLKGRVSQFFSFFHRFRWT